MIAGYLWEGIRAGLVLSILVGPLVILLIQVSLRRGTVASFVAAAGIWSSDILYIVLAHFGLGGLEQITEGSWLFVLIGTIGSIILLTVAVVIWSQPPPRMDLLPGTVRGRGLFTAWLQGFTINTLSPFTLVFWSAFSVTVVHQPGLSGAAALAVYVGIIGTIMLTDSLKVLGARQLRSWLSEERLVWAQRAGAVVLGVFGVVLGLRVWW